MMDRLSATLLITATVMQLCIMNHHYAQALSVDDILTALDAVESNIDNKLFLYQTPAFQWIPSEVYKYRDFRDSLDVMATEGVAGKQFYIGDDDVENGHVLGLVNIAAFLAQSMKETIQYDACDENSWDLVNGKYPLSNACGQLGQSYQDYHCSDEEKHMECPVDKEMSIVGVTHAKWYGAPPPMYCGPKTDEQPFTGFWNYNYECNKGWANPPEVCDVYEDQKAGKFDNSASYANAAGRTDVEGCCWWGRGVIQTSGVCNFGKLNYFLGAGAANDGRSSRYPQIDFCKDPEIICSSPEYKELKWIAGEFYWIESVQGYNEDGWDYLTELRKFVAGGMTGTAFIDGVSGIVNRGCHNPPCGTGALDGGIDRSQNFNKVLDVMFGGSPPQVGISSSDSLLAPSPSSSAAASLAGSPGPPPTRPPFDPTSEVGMIINSKTFMDMETTMDKVKDEIDNKLFLYQTPAFQWIASSVYRYADFIESLYIMATEGVAGKQFYIGDDDVENGHVLGLVNIAAFLAQSMKETIQYDACDENSWDLVNGKYPLSNACGQLGQSYQDYHCSDEEKHMECPVDKEMSIVGVTHAKWYGAPPPMFCGPKTDEQPFTGFWNYNYECNKGWANPPEVCDVYEDQKAGKFDNSASYANTAGRTDVEGCCWWGRGVIQTSGVCNFGKLNYFLGAGAANDGRPSRYPQIDFCKDPEIICSSPEYKELKWIAGEFYWIESVQGYNEDGWDYLTELRKFVAGGMTGTAFIDGVSGIVNRGCHNPPCGTGALDGGIDRSQNFNKVLDVMFGGSPPQVGIPATSDDSDSDSDSNPSTPTTPSTQDHWYPDYNSDYSLGACSNAIPVPAGRPNYENGEACCQSAYGQQASGYCLGSLTNGGQSNQPEQDLPTTPPPVTPNITPNPTTSTPSPKPTSNPITPNPTKNNQPVTTSAPSNKPTPSPSTLSPTTSKPVSSESDGELSVSITSSNIKWYPDHNNDYALGKCSNTLPIPNGRPTFDSGMECCQASYGQQASGACKSMFSEAIDDNAVSDRWYPDYHPNYADGKCINQAPLPSRPNYGSGVECCEKAYGSQASGACLSFIQKLMSSGAIPDQSPIIADELGSTKSNDFISYQCGDVIITEEDPLVVDILYDYEISTENAEDILQDLKQQIMAALANSLGCEVLSQRNLRQTDQMLLGFQSLEGSDLVNTAKAACSELDYGDCVPLKGHLVAYIRHEASVDEVTSTKNEIRGNIQRSMSGDRYSDLTKHIKYTTANIDPKGPNNIVVFIILFVLANIAIVTILLIARKRRERVRSDVSYDGSANEHIHKQNDEILSQTAIDLSSRSAAEQFWDEHELGEQDRRGSLAHALVVDDRENQDLSDNGEDSLDSSAVSITEDDMKSITKFCTLDAQPDESFADYIKQMDDIRMQEQSQSFQQQLMDESENDSGSEHHVRI